MCNKMQIAKWLRKNFASPDDLKSFCDFFELHLGQIRGGKLLPESYIVYDKLASKKYIALFDYLYGLPEISIVERFGRETHKSMMAPHCYVMYQYGHDEKVRRKLFMT